MRKWLNWNFFNSAFNDQERSAISQTYCPADKNPMTDADPGNATRDNIFLLSIKEVEKYFDTSRDLGCEPTKYAYADGAGVIGSDGVFTIGWWLRSPGGYNHCAAEVSCSGSVTMGGQNVNNTYGAVCPALWINL